MFSTIKKVAGVSVAAALLVAGMGSSAHASATDVNAFTLYSAQVAADSLAVAADTSTPVADNLTCDPTPVVTGTMVNPRAQYVVGEVYANVAIAAHWKCASLDTGKSYTITGKVTDYYFYAGAYRAGGSSGNITSGAIAGAATTNPTATPQYQGAHGALNTWHYARFEGRTSTGRTIAWNSELFYVAGV